MAKDYSLQQTPANQILRQKYACDDEWIRKFIEQAQVGHIATQWDEQPFITPILYWYDANKHEIYFHTNIIGRLRANIERNPNACFEACQMGKLFSSNVALHFSMQYESVVAFGKVCVIEDKSEQKRVLYGLIAKYFPGMQPGQEYRPIIDEELQRTGVFAFRVDSWSGKRNWKEAASQSVEWDASDVK
jgi:nitroimidazol reductase NimA-like FMN-containing flavoprotein (pyridoxamine 5'-phosphate oxidase superfamily)